MAAPRGPDLAAVDAGVRRGQDAYNRGEYAAAARTWLDAAELLPEVPEHRDNRAAIYEYAADALIKSIEARDEDVVAAELIAALKPLDRYAEGHAAAYSGQALPATVIKAQVYLRRKLAAREAKKPPVKVAPVHPEAPAPAPAPAEPPRPWKGLAAGGGVTLGAGAAMAVMFGASLARMNQHEHAFNDPANACDPAELQGACAEHYRRGTALDRAAVFGIVAAPVFVAAGATMLALALRRKSGRYTLAPTFGPQATGAVLRFGF
ncbi:hypothetical protein [Nannocystis pusilla]|uniref:Tetratricopeptide repeat protein n=1 Tax=Nannocystis pusilla TaxID=889268 RepID=A0ABS7TN03_9BACT|nr:hypothetical protein [Nannocystis pusilla]MBZ5709604.1 hypothetical protein [Nannocystis pusilla]